MNDFNKHLNKALTDLSEQLHQDKKETVLKAIEMIERGEI